MRGELQASMIWFDVAVILLLTLRMVFFRPALAGNKGEEDESLQLSESWLHDAGSSAITYSCNA
jgi:hypothetical protein